MIKSNYSIKKKQTKKLMVEILSVGIQTRQTLSIIAMSVNKLMGKTKGKNLKMTVDLIPVK